MESNNLNDILNNTDLNITNYDITRNIASVSPWGNVLDLLDTICTTDSVPEIELKETEEKCSNIDTDILNLVAKRFATRLDLDRSLLKNNKEVTECAILCPTW